MRISQITKPRRAIIKAALAQPITYNQGWDFVALKIA